MIQILFCVFDYKGKGKLSIEGVTTVLKILDRWDLEGMPFDATPPLFISPLSVQCAFTSLMTINRGL
jgi:hypothetical protein